MRVVVGGSDMDSGGCLPLLVKEVVGARRSVILWVLQWMQGLVGSRPLLDLFLDGIKEMEVGRDS